MPFINFVRRVLLNLFGKTENWRKIYKQLNRIFMRKTVCFQNKVFSRKKKIKYVLFKNFTFNHLKNEWWHTPTAWFQKH